MERDVSHTPQAKPRCSWKWDRMDLSRLQIVRISNPFRLATSRLRTITYSSWRFSLRFNRLWLDRMLFIGRICFRYQVRQLVSSQEGLPELHSIQAGSYAFKKTPFFSLTSLFQIPFFHTDLPHLQSISLGYCTLDRCQCIELESRCRL